MKIRKYTHYHFTGQDPIVGELHRMKGNSLKNSEISKDSGVASGTLANWWSGRTKRPKFSTVLAVARSLGGDLEIIYNGKRKNIK